MSEAVVRFSMDHPWLVSGVMVAVALLIAVPATLPSLWPETFPMLHPVKVDTDPENMLSKDEAVRVFHNRMKKILGLNDMVVVGVVNDTHEHGVFNVETLTNIYELTEFAKTLTGKNVGEEDPDAGVKVIDLIAPSTVDNIEQGGPGTVKFEWLMPKPPRNEEEALAVRNKALRIPFLEGTMVSEDGKALALYLPISSKNLSYEIYTALRSKIAGFEGDEKYHITGLPVANDVFGVEMFKQMAISAPLAMFVIFILMLIFFRKLILIIAPMIIALVSVVYTMGILVVTGNTIHIMSSMIPIFIMPIAVLNSVHILSEFFERYQQTKNRRQTMESVMQALFLPMLYTSLTTFAGFASLALTPIPPVQVFGIFVGAGVMMAWLLTLFFVPAYLTLIPETRLENFGAVHNQNQEDSPSRGFLKWLGNLTYHHAKLVLAFGVVTILVAIYGISLVQINDNPTKWFKKSHPIRVADHVLNGHFGGTYMAYLALFPKGEDPARLADLATNASEAEAPASDRPNEPGETLGETPSLPSGLGNDTGGQAPLPEGLGGDSEAPRDTASDAPALPAGLGGKPEAEPVIEAPSSASAKESAEEVFKDPEVLRYIADLQQHLLSTGVVGKSNSLADIVKTVHRELIDGTPESYRVPDSSAAVAQCLAQYQSSHRPQDLWHMVTPDYRTTSVWVQLTSGDNKDMSKVANAVSEYMAQNPPPKDLRHKWFGLTYINVIWQDKMVWGMARAFMGSFLVVLLMMIVLFRSGLWGLLSMIPLTITIGFIYGVIGYIGKDYDMPVAVLSSMTLGLAVDFAIHFLARSRAIYDHQGSWEKT
ncbi:MAG: MMPL family transporter, partial [Candidatus Hydrogenedentes bacterium]|nr:MMPL family transporter [Candidatus Hydrogenedentota bacterium]